MTFAAERLREAQLLCKESWLRADLTALTSNGVPLMRANARMAVRPANVEEATIFSQAASEPKQAGDMMLVYLVELDSSP